MTINDFYEIETAATTYPVTLDEARDFLKTPSIVTADDTLIEDILIKAATSRVEKYCNRVFVQRTFTGKFSNLKSSDYEVYPFIELRRSPLISVSSVKTYVDESLTDVDSDSYYLKESPTFARILFTETADCDDDIAYPMEVEFIAGYGAASAVPECIKTAILMYINFMYENRGDVPAEGDREIIKQINMILDPGIRIINSF